MTKDSLDNTIFIDSSAIYALLSNKDPNHKKAEQIFKYIQHKKYSLVLTNLIIYEVHALILNRTRRIDLALHFLNTVAYKTFKVMRPNLIQETLAISKLNKYRDKTWSLTDMISFVVMEQNSIPYYFAFDNDFKQTERFIDISTKVGLELFLNSDGINFRDI